MPSDEQLKPLIALSSSWLECLRSKDEAYTPIERSTLLVADEGGMGKTYSCSIALNWILETEGQSVIVICPPALNHHGACNIETGQADEGPEQVESFPAG